MRTLRLRRKERTPGRATVWIVVALALAGPLASGNVGRVDSDEIGTGYVGDEPNVRSGGALPGGVGAAEIVLDADVVQGWVS